MNSKHLNKNYLEYLKCVNTHCRLVFIYLLHTPVGVREESSDGWGGEADGKLRVITSCALKMGCKEKLTYAPPTRGQDEKLTAMVLVLFVP